MARFSYPYSIRNWCNHDCHDIRTSTKNDAMNDTSNTTNAASQSDIPQSVSDFMRHITDLCGGEHARWAENFNAGFANTLTTTVRRHDDGTTFLLTGDIPACGCATPQRNSDHISP